jgi:hypothetical protein
VIKFNFRVDTFYDAEEPYFDGNDIDDNLKNKQYLLVFPNDV